MSDQNTNGSETPRTKTPRVFVSLNVRGLDVSPDAVTRRLGINPTKTWLGGEVVPKTILKHKDNLWGLQSGAPRTDTIQRHLELLLDMVEPVRSRLLELSESARVQFYCEASDYGTGVDLSFGRDLIKRIAAIGAELDIDYCYFDSSTEEG